MNYTRIYTDENGDSRLELVELPLVDFGSVGFLSSTIDVSHLQFRETKSDYDWDFHVAPNRQFIILLNGQIEITTSLGDVRTFKGGDILLAEDTKGKGHKTRNLTNAKRKSLFIII
jgi:hypothetical protein